MLFALVFLLLVGCQSETQVTEGLSLSLKFPLALKSNPNRLKRFLTRSDRMVVRVTGSEIREYVYPVGKWDRIQLPYNKGDAIKLRVQIWDRDPFGRHRTYPCLVGKTTIPRNSTQAEVVLRMQVSVREYDL